MARELGVRVAWEQEFFADPLVEAWELAFGAGQVKGQIVESPNVSSSRDVATGAHAKFPLH